MPTIELPFTKGCLVIFMLLSAIAANAVEIVRGIKIDGIVYDLIDDEAEVSYKNKRDYKGDIVIPSSIVYKKKTYLVTKIGDAFWRQRELKSVSIPNSVHTISADAFGYCRGLESITLPEGLKIIGNYAFQGCTGLTSMTIPVNVKQIGKGAFRECEKLKSVTIYGKIEQLAMETFRDCYQLTTVELPNSLREIEGSAFFNCGSLENLIIPDNVSYISQSAFENCLSLISVTLPKEISSIMKRTFAGCAKLETIVFPQNVKYIADEVFFGCKSLKAVSLPDIITSIGSAAFEGCSSLTSIEIPFGVKNINGSMFTGCTNLKEIYVSNKSFTRWDFNAKDIYPDFRVIYGKPSSQSDLAKNQPQPEQAKHAEEHGNEQEAEPSPETIVVKTFPNLNVVSGTLSFIDQSGSNAVRANGSYRIRFRLQNTGKGDAVGCKVKVSAKGNTNGIKYADMDLPPVQAGQSINVDIPITSDSNTSNGKVEFSVMVDEPNGFGTDSQVVTVNTRAAETPSVIITDYAVTADNSHRLSKKQPFDLQLMLQNTMAGLAENVEVGIELPDGVTLLDGNSVETIDKLTGGEARLFTYSLIISNHYTATVVPVKIKLKEKYGKYAENRTIELVLNQSLANTKLSLGGKQKDTVAVHLDSDVDINIPESDVKNVGTYAVIIANEHYQLEESVPYAINDGTAFETYCRQSLGIPQENIRKATDVTLGQLKYWIDWLRRTVEAEGDKARVIFYYAGHGIPDEESKASYLLPVDGYGSNTTTGYSLNELYQQLASMPSQSVTVFLDACFSGANRDGNMLSSARGVAVKAKQSMPKGNLVVLSATQGDETAYPFEAKHHGLFTYYMLKKFQESEGGATLGELADFVTQEVRRQSLLQNNKRQTPTATAAPNMQDSWRLIKLKK